MALPHAHVILLCALHKSCQVILSYHNNSHINATIITSEIHGESSKAYRTKLLPLEQKLLMNIQLDVMLFDEFSQTWSCILFI